MRILLTHRYFWPDSTPYAVILKKIATRLANDGHDVTVLSTQPGYKPESDNQKQPKFETIDGYRVYRVSLVPGFSGFHSIISAVNMIVYFLFVVLHSARNRKFDIVMNATSPPILAGLAGRLASSFSKAKHFYHFMDIHPEIGRISGEFSNPWIYNLLVRIDSYTCARADHIFVLSEDMKNSLMARKHCTGAKISVLQNFDLTSNDTTSTESDIEQFKKPDGVFRVIFAGNIGRFQNLEAIVDSFLDNNEENVQLVLLGDGKLKRDLVEKVKESQSQSVIFFPHQTVEAANRIIGDADMGLISLTPGIYKYAYPTKLISYLSVGCPVVAAVESQSALATFIEEQEIGISVTPEQLPQIVRFIKEKAQAGDNMLSFRTNAGRTYNSFYLEQTVLDIWSRQFQSSETDPGT